MEEPIEIFLKGEYQNKEKQLELLNVIISDFKDYFTLNHARNEKKKVFVEKQKDIVARERLFKAKKNGFEDEIKRIGRNISLDQNINNNPQINLLKSKINKLNLQHIQDRKVNLRDYDELKSIWKKVDLETEESYNQFRIALLQKKDLMDNIQKQITGYKKSKSILVLKSQWLILIINCVQISIIIVSTIITVFESVKSKFQINSFVEIIIPIACSTYIAFILSVARFFKFDTKKEFIEKVIEKYSYIINRLRHRLRCIDNFDFKIRPLKKWDDLISTYDEDGLQDMITKTIEEADTLLTLTEYVYYTRIYLKLSFKRNLLQKNNKNLNKLTNKAGVDFNVFKKREPWYRRLCKWCCCKVNKIDYEEFFFNAHKIVDDNKQQIRNASVSDNYNDDYSDIEMGHIVNNFDEVDYGDYGEERRRGKSSLLRARRRRSSRNLIPRISSGVSELNKYENKLIGNSFKSELKDILHTCKREDNVVNTTLSATQQTVCFLDDETNEVICFDGVEEHREPDKNVTFQIGDKTQNLMKNKKIKKENDSLKPKEKDKEKEKGKKGESGNVVETQVESEEKPKKRGRPRKNKKVKKDDIDSDKD